MENRFLCYYPEYVISIIIIVLVITVDIPSYLSHQGIAFEFVQFYFDDLHVKIFLISFDIFDII